ncbi:acyl-CoA dehydrogenase family protein [Paenibacillus sp. W2I17]|uniref:acyl-CoA dehydrogenase family protein n=1 Tax=Paenibacillus sp. W2I17 TaxID=3042311 RepID=UPI0027842088|nr:acyl-CoA dehydrogenase family protein [Paenibacillus sp. W2I17]MDQ0660890.1 alkylation response protein AidB-like acyl-CoA dehydrogenase [Paenibacillus sp. W2I17]
MKVELNAEQLMWQEQFKDFVDSEIIPYASVNDSEERIHPELLAKITEAGYLGSMLPKEYGWDGTGQYHYRDS